MPDSTKVNRYHELGLVCHDRGERYWLSQTSAQPLGASLRTVKPTAPDSLEQILLHGRVDTPSGDWFLPRDLLLQSRDTGLVAHALSNCHNLHLPDQETAHMASKICGSSIDPEQSFIRIFTLLVIMEQVESIQDFIRLNIKDASLPLQGVLQGQAASDLSNVFIGWKRHSSEYFSRHQYGVIAPFFARPDGIPPHYVFTKLDVLPFRSLKQISADDDDIPSVMFGGYGGFSDVSCIEIHQSNHGFRDWSSKHQDGNNSFALKRLKPHNFDSFKQEVLALTKVRKTTHIIQLLATYEIDSTYHMIFPLAKGDIHRFWSIVENRVQLAPWMVTQMAGLTEALSVIHDGNTESNGQNGDITYGRHGDIKAANVLWFSEGNHPGTLVLTDFGLSDYHQEISRSRTKAELLAYSPTYSGPEFDAPGGLISRKSDIWSLGCLFLEFVTWYLLGKQAALDEFAEFRAELDKSGFDNDVFFRRVGKDCIEVKPQVITWISRLRNQHSCLAYLRKLLDIIEHQMLVVDRDKRASSSELSAQLNLMSTEMQAKQILQDGTDTSGSLS